MKARTANIPIAQIEARAPRVRRTPRMSELTPEEAIARRDNRRAWRHANKDKVRASKRASYHRHKESNLLRSRKHRADNRSRYRGYTLKRSHGLSLAAYADMLASQGGRCSICRRPPARIALAVDHDHVTGAIRGLLCDPCNRGIGFLQDSQAVIGAALAYLKRHSQQSFLSRKVPS